MELVFISNFLNHHQIPLANNLYSILGDNYKFIATEKMPMERKKMGYIEVTHDDYPYLYKSDKSNYLDIKAISLNSDVVIYGSAPFEIVSERIDKNKLTLCYSERIFKNKRIAAYLALTGKLHKLYVKPGRKSNVYVLCASAYMAIDLKKIHSFKNRTYKWGYFTQVKEYDLDELFQKKRHSLVHLLWVGRFIDWKYPEYPIKVAVRLKDEGFKFKLNMIGVGIKLNKIKKMIREYGLEDYVILLGAMSPERVREYMELSNIFIFTSNKNEGWGAVLNEAMNSACAVVACNAIGSVPFLIEEEINGSTYTNQNLEELYCKVEALMDDERLRRQFGINAYRTILNIWNPRIAAERLLILVDDLNKYGTCDRFADGPCSHT